MSRLERLYTPPEIGAPGKRAARSRRRDLLLAGGFVLAMAAIAVLALGLVTPGLIGGTYRVHAYFAEAKGLDPGIQVMQEGYVIGMVESVKPVFPDRDSDAAFCPPPPRAAVARSPVLPCFRANLRIRKRWPVPADSSAQLGPAGLLKGDAIDLRPGISETLLTDGDRIAATGREGDLMAELSTLTESVQTLVNETLQPALASIQQQIKTIGDLLGTETGAAGNRERLAGIFESLQQLAANIEKAVNPDQLSATLKSVEELSRNLAQVSGTLTARSADIQHTVRSYGDLAKELRGLVKETKPPLQRSLDDTQYALQQLAAALTPILTNIEDATRNLSALSRDLRTNPAVIIKGREEEKQAPWFK
ncbi:MAG: MlaD family protein [Chromatiaceae bacterium]